ncbi:Sorting nexin-29 [Varanus komodoensis]|nr:Sorting nexin-29 [Varanus komodoensis]
MLRPVDPRKTQAVTEDQTASGSVGKVYIRIKDDEWNVYRRYAEFRTLHHKLQMKYHQVRSFNFPPKKAIGNKSLQLALFGSDSGGVEEEGLEMPLLSDSLLARQNGSSNETKRCGAIVTDDNSGEKDAKFVEERRKQLQIYLRNVMNKVIQILPEFTANPKKETLTQLMPFVM